MTKGRNEVRHRTSARAMTSSNRDKALQRIEEELSTIAVSSPSCYYGTEPLRDKVRNGVIARFSVVRQYLETMWPIEYRPERVELLEEENRLLADFLTKFDTGGISTTELKASLNRLRYQHDRLKGYGPSNASTSSRN